MKVAEVLLFQYALPFARPFLVAGQSLSLREGLIVHVLADNGVCGIGEIAPLPGLSIEPLKKSVYQARALSSQLLSVDVPENADELRQVFASELFEGVVPSVRFGIEMALLHAAAQHQGISIAGVLGCSALDDIATAGLLQGKVEEVMLQAQTMARQGYRTFKLKVGSKNIPLDIKKVAAVREVLLPGSQLRLDANRGWGLQEALAFAGNIGPQGIEFIEDPLNDLTVLGRFIRESGLPVALDESLAMFDPQRFSGFEGVDFLVVKPMVHGGIVRAIDWMAKAAERGQRVVISSAFESGAGRTVLANLAALTGCVAGLGTQGWFKADLMERPVVGPNGVIARSSLIFHPACIRQGLLTKIV